MTAYSLESLSLDHCTVSGNIEATNMSVISSHVQGEVNCLENLYATNSQFDRKIDGYTIGLYGCILNGIVWARDYEGQITAIFDRNVFTANSYIRLESDDNYTDQVKVALTATNNTFYSTQYNGLYVQVFNNNDRYLHNDPTKHTWTWEGNSGTCLQTFFETVKTINMSTFDEGIEGLRFISFGLVGYPNVLPNPISITFKEIPARQSVGSDIIDPIEYIVSSDNQTNYFYINKYSSSDYFAHRFHLGQGRLSGNFAITTKTIGKH
jgi:hypothetical protein